MEIVYRCNSHLPVRPGYFTWYLSGSETRCRKEILSSPIWPTKHYLRYVQRHTNILCYRDDALTHQCVADTHTSKCKIDVVSAIYFQQLWTINGLKSLSRFKLIWQRLIDFYFHSFKNTSLLILNHFSQAIYISWNDIRQRIAIGLFWYLDLNLPLVYFWLEICYSFLYI